MIPYFTLPTEIYLLVGLALGFSTIANLFHLLRVKEEIDKIRELTVVGEEIGLTRREDGPETRKEDEQEIEFIKKKGNVVPNLFLLAIQVLALIFLGSYFLDPIIK